MASKANREWQDLPKRLNCFTVRNAAMIDLDTKEKELEDLNKQINSPTLFR